jgi:hypothetical protein
MGESARARAHWGRARKLVASGRVSTAAGKLRRATRGLVKRAPRSALGRMLSSSSSSRSARLWSRTQLCAVVVSLGVHAASTVEGALSKYPRTLFLLEVATSLLFSLDYVFRLCTCREKSRFSRLGPVSARLRWALSRDALLSAVSCVPAFVDGSAAARTGRWHDAVVTGLHLTPVLLLTRTARWRSAVRTARRVVFVNRYCRCDRTC